MQQGAESDHSPGRDATSEECVLRDFWTYTESRRVVYMRLVLGLTLMSSFWCKRWVRNRPLM